MSFRLDHDVLYIHLNKLLVNMDQRSTAYIINDKLSKDLRIFRCTKFGTEFISSFNISYAGETVRRC